MILPRGFGGAVVALMGIGLAAAVLNAREATHPLPVSSERLMYLQSGETADRLFLSFDALASDLYWIRTIQHYGSDRRSSRTSDRFELLYPLLDVTTSLDPSFNLAYRFGAVFLSTPPPNGPGNTTQAIQLLEKGLAANPHRWQYAHDIGFIHYWHTGDFGRAAEWFRKASDMPGAPEWLRPLAALTLAEGGNREAARRIFTELATSEERYLRSSATRSLAQLQALDEIDLLRALIEKYRAATGTYPASWVDLIRAGLLRGTPADATNTPYFYEPKTHDVRLSPASSLSPLPQGMARR